MTVKYTNQSGQTYYLHKKLTKRGNFRYYFAKDDSVNLVDKIPDSYEIYENPKGQVFLRKKNKSFIREEDVKLVEKLIAENTDLEHFYLNCQNNTIILYLPDIDVNDISGMLNITMEGNEIKLNQFSPGNLTYSPYIQIIYNNETKIYSLEKINPEDHLKRWINLNNNNNLEELMQNNIKHFSNKTYSKLKILFL